MPHNVDFLSGIVGPEKPREYPVRQMIGRLESEEEEEEDDSVRDLTTNQLLDFLTTEYLMKSPVAFQGGFFQGPGRETNPLPGMQSSLGRLGWGMLENLLARELVKRKSGLRKVLPFISGIHGTLAIQNSAIPRTSTPLGNTR